VETGTAVSILTTKSKLKVLDSINVNLYGGKNLKTKNFTIGAGVEKEINVNELFKVGVGLYGSRSVKDFFNLDIPTNWSVGISGTLRF